MLNQVGDGSAEELGLPSSAGGLAGSPPDAAPR
jgi:hypothetical protein